MTAKQLYGISAKAVEEGIRALPMVLKKHKNVKYMVLGDGEGRKNLENLVKDLNLNEYVIFVGNKKHDEIPEYLAASDIIIQTFIIEITVGTSLLESLAMGKPLVVTNCGEIGNILNASNAMLVKMKDLDSIANGINKLIEAPELRKSLGNNARKLIEEKYNAENTAKRILETAETLTRKKGV